ncbi:MAG TPA: 4'-phosphopantetheinyl transferase superfamily protein [Mucilaginibacter sp.]|jgi:4'-phosphopantetheinyl transferase|nr:4'-phosphopantetheinyl transferase superfamily protein [Mucilaginibacter sp.]
MIICCHSEIPREWDKQELSNKLDLLSPALQEAALRKRRLIDKQLFIAGKLLVREVLKEFDLEHHSFHDLEYNTHKRPYFNAGVDFNISHSGNRVVCCGTVQGVIGIDIEHVKVINLDDYPDFFTQNEWDFIHSHADKFDGFYKIWTRKEAVLKAIGTGFYTPLNSVDVVEDTVEYDGLIYYIQSVEIAGGYPCHIASTVQDEIKLMPVEL